MEPGQIPSALELAWIYRGKIQTLSYLWTLVCKVGMLNEFEILLQCGLQLCKHRLTSPMPYANTKFQGVGLFFFNIKVAVAANIYYVIHPLI